MYTIILICQSADLIITPNILVLIASWIALYSEVLNSTPPIYKDI